MEYHICIAFMKRKYSMFLLILTDEIIHTDFIFTTFKSQAFDESWVFLFVRYRDYLVQHFTIAIPHRIKTGF